MKKQQKTLHFFSILLLLGALFPITVWSQETKLTIVSDFRFYEQNIERNQELKLLNINEFVKYLQVDLKYSTTNNFTGKRLYPNHLKTPFLILKAATALKSIAVELENQGYGIKIFDAYRPYYVTKRFWELIKDERYVANPAKGSGHNRGVAVDLTLFDIQTGKELNMGTGFDNFSDTAHHSFKNLSSEVIANRKRLKETMEKFGFVALETEWWHYALPNSTNYPILNIDFKKINRKL